MKKILLTITLLPFLSLLTYSQDRGRLSIHYTDNRVPFIGNGYSNGETGESPVRGFTAEADLAVYKYKKTRFSLAYNFQQQYNVEVYPDYFDGMNTVDLYRDVQSHFGLAQFEYAFRYAIAPFIAAGGGTTKIHEDATRQSVVKLRVGVNIPFTKESPIFAKVYLDSDYPTGRPYGGFINPDTRHLGFGIGFKF